ARGGRDPRLEGRAPRLAPRLGPLVVLRVEPARAVAQLRARHGEQLGGLGAALLTVGALEALLLVQRPTGEALQAALLHEPALRVARRHAVLALGAASLLVLLEDLAAHEPRAGVPVLRHLNEH